MGKNAKKFEKILKINLELEKNARGSKMESRHKVAAKEATPAWAFNRISPQYGSK